MSRRGAVLLLVGLLPALAAATTPPPQGTVTSRVEGHLEVAMAGGLEPTDFAHLVFVQGWRSSFADFRTLDTALDRLGAVKADPLMAGELLLARQRSAAAEGRIGDARALFARQGGLTHWWAEGPSSLDELGDFARTEQPPGPDAQWRAAPGVDPEGWLRADGLGWPAQRQLIFLATTVTSAQVQAVAVRLGAAQAARLWLNGEQLLTSPQPLERADDQLVVGGWLRQGANLLVVAVATEQDGWWLRARLTAPDGSPLEGVTERDQPPQPQPAVGRPAPEVRSLEVEIHHAAEAGEPGARLAWAAYQVTRRPGPADSGDAAEACQQARTDAPGEARLLEWLVTTEPGAARELLEDALAADSGLVWARIALARWYHAHDLDETAHTLLLGIDEPAARAAALDLDADRWGPLELPQLTALARAWPRSLDVQQVLAERAGAAGQWGLLRTAVERLEAIAPGTPPVRQLAEKLASNCADQTELLRLARRELSDDPNSPDLRLRVSRLLTAADDPVAAREVLETGLARCPGHPDLLGELARLEHAQGHDQRAAALAQQLVALRPQDRPARRLLVLLGEGREDLSWVRAPAQLRALPASAATVTAAEILLDHQEVRFLPGNLVEERVQRAVLVRNARQVEALRSDSVAWVPERQRLRVLAARVLRADGSELSARQDDTPRLRDPAVNMYYDTRLRVVRYPELEDGDLVELTYVLSETAEANETGPYKGGLVMLAGAFPTGLTELELSGRPELLPAWELAHLEQQPTRTTDPDGTVHLRWSWRDLPAVPAELPRPPVLLATPHMVYSNHPDWGELGDWYARHVAPRVVASRQVEETAHRLVDGIDDRRGRIAAIYRYVTDEIRYVGLELGEHRFRPFSADWVMSHRMGDCKDKAALLVALLGAVDIPARMVLLRTSDQGPVVAKLALLEDFNHAIAYLPDDDLWLDGTATGHDPARPPGLDQGAWALVVEGSASRPQTTPRPGAGVVSRELTLRAAGDGMVELRLAAEDTGDAADALRGRLAGSRDPRRFASWLQELFPGAEVEGDPASHLLPGRDPATVTVDARLPRTALLGVGGVPLYPGDLASLTRLAPGEERTTDLLLNPLPELRWTMTVDLGRAAGDLPPPAHVKSAFGKLNLTVEAMPTGYRVHGALVLTPGLVPAESSGALRSFLVTVQRVLDRRAEVP